MKSTNRSIIALGLAIAAIGVLPATAYAQAQAHMGHVGTAWSDTPDGMGFLPTARAEADIAAQHAGLAAGDLGNLDSMKLHAGHVLHALDPSAEAGGPGLGYGVITAAQGVVDHIGFAAAAPDASDNVKLHSDHIAASSTNVLDWSGQASGVTASIIARHGAQHAIVPGEESKRPDSALIPPFDCPLWSSSRAWSQVRSRPT